MNVYPAIFSKGFGRFLNRIGFSELAQHTSIIAEKLYQEQELTVKEIANSG